MILIPDDSEVSLLDLVVGLHRPEAAVVKDGHEEALRKVVQVLIAREEILSFHKAAQQNLTRERVYS